MALRHLKQSMKKQSNMNSCREKQNDSTMNVSTLGADHLIPTGGLWFFCEKKDCSENFGK